MKKSKKQIFKVQYSQFPRYPNGTFLIYNKDRSISQQFPTDKLLYELISTYSPYYLKIYIEGELVNDKVVFDTDTKPIKNLYW